MPKGQGSQDGSFFTMIFKPYMIFPVVLLFLFHQSSKSRMQTTSAALKPGLDISRISVRPAGTFLKPFLQSRTPGSPGSKSVQIFLMQHFSYLGWKIEIDQFVSPVPPSNTPTKFTNMIFTLNPDAPRRLILAAHYDSKVRVDGQQYDGQFIGATDSAWPCSLLTELAFALTPRLKESPSFRDLTIQMIFFDGEEAHVHWSAKDSIYGARHLAQEWAKDRKNRIDPIELFVLLDLLGASNPSIVPLMPNTKQQFAKLADVEDRLKPSLSTTSGRIFNRRPSPQVAGVAVEDDHVPFMELGVPILHIIPVPFPSVWHSMADDENALDNNIIKDLTLIFHTYLEDYFQLKPTPPQVKAAHASGNTAENAMVNDNVAAEL